MAINLIEQLSKPKPLAKKAEELGTVQPTQPNLAKALGASQKSAEMAPSPQAKTAAQQKQMRSAQVQAQAPREEVPEADEFRAKADTMISKLAENLTQENIQQEISQDIAAGPEAGVEALTEEQALQQMQAGEAPVVDESQVISDVLEGSGLPEAFNLTMAEIDDPDIKAYAAELGLPETATVADLKQAVDTEIDQITSIVDNARETISDPNQPSNVRQESVNLMRDYGASHLIATDAELESFEKDIQNVGLIEIDGQTLTLEEVGDNPAIAASLHTAAEAFIDNPDVTPEDAGLKDNPLLYEFVKKHSNSIISTLDSSREALDSAKQTVADNKAMTDWMPPELKKDINIYTTEDLTTQLPGLLVFKGDNEVDKETVKYLAEIGSDLANQFLQGNITDLADLKTRKDTHQALSAAGSLPELTSTFQKSIGEVETLVSDYLKNPDAYSDAEKQVFEALDANKDGQVDDWPSVQAKLQSMSLDGNINFSLANAKTPDQRYQENLAAILPQDAPIESLGFRDLNQLIQDMNAGGIKPEDIAPIIELRDQKRKEAKAQADAEKAQKFAAQQAAEEAARVKQIQDQKRYTQKIIVPDTKKLADLGPGNTLESVKDFTAQVEDRLAYIGRAEEIGDISPATARNQKRILKEQLRKAARKRKLLNSGLQSAYER